MTRYNLIGRIALAVGLGVVATTALATGEIRDTFLSHYKISESSPLGKAGCNVCHVSDADPTFNPFGKDVKDALTAAHKDVPDAALFESIEAKDSDGDGTSNKDEIAANTLPGDAKSGAKAGAPPPKAPEKPLIPKNGFHPAIVHFPIALFIAGLLLDFLGMVRKDKTLLYAGWYNIIFAAVTSFAGVASGLLAMTLKKLTFQGLMMNHILYAGGATVAMCILVGMRVHRHEEMSRPARVVYYILATSAFLAISYAGHLGGTLVYGE